MSTDRPNRTVDPIVAAAARRGIRIVSESDTPDTPAPDPQPQIVAHNRQLCDQVADAWLAMVRRAPGESTVYRRDGRLVRLAYSSRGAPPTLQEPTIGWIRWYLSSSAEWVRYSERGGVTAVHPPDAVCSAILGSTPHLLIPELAGVSPSPIMDRTGAIQSKVGYCQSECTWISGHSVPPVDDSPTGEDILSAVELIRYAVCDFPFESAADLATWAAMLFLPFLKPLLRGAPTPIHLFTATRPRCGKSRLVDLAHIAWSGTLAPSLRWSHDPIEMDKVVTSAIMCAKSHMCFDNADGRHQLDSAAVASAVTQGVWSARVLGGNTILDSRVAAVWSITSNNPQISSELSDRCVRCHLSPDWDNPSERTGWRERDILGWAKSNRARLAHSVLTILRAWHNAGAPLAQTTMGSFETWAGLLGGVLNFAGFRGLLANRRSVAEDVSDDSELREFVKKWHETHGSSLVSASDLASLARESDLLSRELGTRCELSQSQRIGRYILRSRGAVFNGHRIVTKRDSRSRGMRYGLDPVGQKEPMQ